MDHIVYLDHKAKELPNLLDGSKTMIIRGAMGRKLPYGRVSIGDILYFIENKGDGLVKAKALVAELVQTNELSPNDSVALVNSHQSKLLLDSGLMKRFTGKRYLILVSVKDIEPLNPFKIDRSQYGNMDDWLPVGDINTVKTI